MTAGPRLGVDATEPRISVVAAEPRISVVVCTCRRHAVLGACLAALDAQTVARADREIIVVDNSADQRATEAFAWPDEVRLIVADRPGLSHARNIGAAAARAPVVAFIDDDAAAAPDWLAAIRRAFDESSGAGAVGGRVVPVWGAAPPPWLDAWHDGFLSIVERGPAARDLDAGEWLAGTNIAFAADALRDGPAPFAERLGRFPGKLLGNEEIALLARVRAAGRPVRYDPRIVVRHIIPAERLTQAWMRRRVAWQAISDLMLDDASMDGDPAEIRALWGRVARYLKRLPPAWRGPAGLLRDEADAAGFRAQNEAIAAMIHLLVGHGESVEQALLGGGEAGRREMGGGGAGAGETGGGRAGAGETGGGGAGGGETGGGRAGAGEMGAGETGAGGTGRRETGAREMGADETDGGETGGRETGRREMEAGDAGAGQTGAGGAGAGETGAGEAGRRETDRREMGAGDAGGGGAGGREMGARGTGAGETGAGEAGRRETDRREMGAGDAGGGGAGGREMGARGTGAGEAGRRETGGRELRLPALLASGT